jgi:hypothetical protein
MFWTVITICLVLLFGPLFIGCILGLIMTRISASLDRKSPTLTVTEWKRMLEERNN